MAKIKGKGGGGGGDGDGDGRWSSGASWSYKQRQHTLATAANDDEGNDFTNDGTANVDTGARNSSAGSH